MLNWFAKRLAEVQEKKASGEAGFTLIELLVVVIIIGILAAIAIPTFLAQREKALESAVKSDVRNAVTVNGIMVADDGSGIADGTYDSDDTLGTGESKFVPSGGVTLAVSTAAAADGGEKTIKGTHTDTGTYSFTYNATNGKYIEVQN